jgi:hypothetical protein
MHYRWSFPENREFAMAEFGRTSAPSATPEEQRAIGEKLAGPFAGALPHLGITPATIAAIERSYLAFLDDLEQHLARHPFLLGTRPSIGDYGLIGPLYAHLWRDPYSQRLMQARSPRVADWVKRMQWPHASQNEPGEFLPDDQVPETLLPLLARTFRELVPVLKSTEARLAAWASEHPEAGEVPRAIGAHSFTIDDSSEQRAITPYPLWMWQRARDHLRGLDAATSARAESLLSPIPGAYEALRAPLSVRVERVHNRIHLERARP